LYATYREKSNVSEQAGRVFYVLPFFVRVRVIKVSVIYARFGVLCIAGLEIRDANIEENEVEMRVLNLGE
jgi:hypothetical protein